MARRRKKKQTRRSASRLRFGVVGLICLAAVGAIAFAQGGLDRVGGLLGGRESARAATDPTRTAAIPSLPRRMQAPESRPQVRSRMPRAETPQPKRSQPAAARQVRKVVAPVRPPVGLPRTTPAPQPAGLVPARRPQSGNCACPYDLMINGTQCGARSTYLTPGREKPACYR